MHGWVTGVPMFRACSCSEEEVLSSVNIEVGDIKTVLADPGIEAKDE